MIKTYILKISVKLRKTPKIFSILILFLLISAPFATKTFAADYSQRISVLYDINESYGVGLNYHIALTNLTDDRYVNKYKLTLPFLITTAEGRYGNDALTTTIEKQDKKTIVTVNLKQVVGKNKVNEFDVKMGGVDIMKVQGNLMNAFIPGIVKSDDIESYGISLEFSKKLPPLNYVSSEALNIEDKGDKLRYNFDPNVLQTSGLLLTFGDRQSYDFEFNYKIDDYTKNYVDHNSEIKLALPYDNSYQDIFYTNINPAPIRSYQDEDGNYISVFNYDSLISSKTNQILFQGTAYVKPKVDILKTKGTTTLTSQEMKTYTSKQEFWETDNSQIKTIVDTNTQGKKTTVEKARALYDFTVKTLKYSREELAKKNRQRLGAVQALQTPNNAICQEYADLFVTLTRAAGIPSRIVVGLAQTPEESINPVPQTVLHAWNEFYDEQTDNWISVDPTWQSTSNGELYFDRVGSNHFEMYINGVSSTFPIIPLSFTPADNPANTLKLSSTNKFDFSANKDVVFDLASKDINTTLDDKVNTTLTNNSLQVVRIKDIKVEGATLGPGITFDNAIIFPKANTNFAIRVQNKNLWGEEKKTLTITGSLFSTTMKDFEQTQQFNIVVRGSPFIRYMIVSVVIGVLFIIMMITIALVKRYKYNKMNNKTP